MKNNKVLKGLILIFAMVISFIAGASTKHNKEVVKVENILYSSTDNFHLDNNDIGIEFSNGSWAVANLVTNEYTFQPVELGDWDYSEFNSLEAFENCIKTYLNIKNNGSY